MIEERVFFYYCELGFKYFVECYEEILFQYYMDYGQKDKVFYFVKNCFEMQMIMFILG